MIRAVPTEPVPNLLGLSKGENVPTLTETPAKVTAFETKCVYFASQ